MFQNIRASRMILTLKITFHFLSFTIINIRCNYPYLFSCYHHWNTHLSDVLLLQTLEAAETSDG